MLCSDLIQRIEAKYPKGVAEEWDNVGLLLGSMQKDIKKVYIALDATDEVIQNAIAYEADLLLTHHPLVFSPMKQVTDETMEGRRMLALLQSDMCYYAMHTNYDILRMADLSADLMGLAKTEILMPTDAEETKGIGRVGSLDSPMTVRECCELVKERFRLDAVKVYGKLDQKVSRVAISPGSGKHMSEQAIAKGAEVFVTAEIDHHEGIDSNAEGMAIIDAGHYGLEHIFIEDMSNFLQENLEGIEVFTAAIAHPFQIV